MSDSENGIVPETDPRVKAMRTYTLEERAAYAMELMGMFLQSLPDEMMQVVVLHILERLLALYQRRIAGEQNETIKIPPVIRDWFYYETHGGSTGDGPSINPTISQFVAKFSSEEHYL